MLVHSSGVGERQTNRRPDLVPPSVAVQMIFEFRNVLGCIQHIELERRRFCRERGRGEFRVCDQVTCDHEPGVESTVLTFVDGVDADVLLGVPRESSIPDLDFRGPHGVREMLVQTFQEDLSDCIELFL